MPQPTSTVALRNVLEVTPGTSPTTGWKEIPYTGESLVGQRGSVDSALMNVIGAREKRGSIRTSAGGGGSVTSEMHAGSFDDWLEGLFGSAWSSNVLTVGTTKKSYSIEKKFTDLTAVRYQIFKRMYVDSLALGINAEQIFTCEFGFLGNKPTWGSTQGSTLAPTAAVANDPYNAVDHITGILEGGSAQAGVNAITLQFNNAFRQLRALGSANPYAVQFGQFDVKGTVQVFLEDETLINKFENNTESSLFFTLGTGGVKEYDFLFNKTRYTNGRVVAGAPNGDVLVEMDWEAHIDATNTTTKITRRT